MIYTMYSTDSGRILQTVECPVSEADLQIEGRPGVALIAGEHSFRDGYINAGAFVQFPVRPSNYHHFDWTDYSWHLSADSVYAAQTRIKTDIEVYRQTLEQSIIVYDGKNLQADAEAIKNINGKLQEIKSREDLGVLLPTASLFWRDADNIIHSWQDSTTYKQWLQGLAIAIAERASTLYMTSWQKKAAIDVLGDTTGLTDAQVSDRLFTILSYDVNAGWGN